MLFNTKRRTHRVCPKTGKVINDKFGWSRLIWPISGLFCLVWFLIRVIPKPSRAAYPCQRVAFPLASGFMVWLMGLGASALIFRRAKSHFSNSRLFSGSVCAIISIACIWLCLSFNADKNLKAAGSTPANSPIGIAKGVHPGRVVWVHDPNATTWNGVGDGHWWQPEHTSQQQVNLMLEHAICSLAGRMELASSWNDFFIYFNQNHDKGSVGYTHGEKIMIKVNFVDMIAVGVNNGSPPITDYNCTSSRHHPDYPNCSPQVIHALLDQLINVVGVAQSDITVGDPTCLWSNEFYAMLYPDFPNVQYLDYLGLYNRTQAVKSTVPFYWSTSHADGKAQDYVLQQYADAAYFINLPTLKAHYNVGGITVCGKNHYGSLRGPTINTNLYYSLHMDAPFTVPASGNYRPMVDLMGHRDVGGKTLLCLVDGLWAGQHGKTIAPNTSPVPLKWQMAPFNNDWPSSIFVSQDQIAMDSVAFDFLVNEWPDTGGPGHAGTDDYLHEAAEANNPPSGTFYDPEHDGTRLASLGVHEHWNNSTDKQYTRNLGTGNGIELVKAPLTLSADFNGNGKVDWVDFAIFAQFWNQTGTLADIAPQPVPNGIVDFNDLFVFCDSWLTATMIPPLPAQASSPAPSDNAIMVGINTDLSWTAGTDAESHDVYFGTTNPPLLVSPNQIATTYDPGTLAADVTYFWRIDEINQWGKTTGTVWKFTTGVPLPLPGKATGPSPASSATGIAVTNDLSWIVGTNAASHDVYFGTASPGTFQRNQTSITFDTGTMAHSTTYYWRIDEKNATGTTMGDVWNFTTAAATLSDTTDDLAGTITAQGENPPSEGKAKAFDNSTTTKWLDFANGQPNRASWIQYQYASGKKSVVSEYTITSANDSPERDPKNWNLLGSNDGGTTWTTIDSRTGETFPTRYLKRSFTTSNATAYNTYKLDITSVANPTAANSVQLAEVELLGTTPAP